MSPLASGSHTRESAVNQDAKPEAAASQRDRAAALTHPRGKQKFRGRDKGQDSLPSGCRQTVLRNRCFRMSSQGASRNVSRGQNPNDIKQETRTVCNLKVCTLIDVLTYRGVAETNIYSKEVNAELAKSMPSTPK